MGLVEVRSGQSRFARPSASRRRHGSPLDRAKAHEVVWDRVAPIFEAARSVTDASFVYFIGEPDDGAVKIGVAKNPIDRLRGMQTGNPRRMRIEHVLLGDRDIEKLLHELWESYAIPSLNKQGRLDVAPGTEWFHAEIRESLFPIIATTAEKQVWLCARGKASPERLQRMVREAHGQHGFVATGRDETRLLAQGVGYVVAGRQSRI